MSVPADGPCRAGAGQRTVAVNPLILQIFHHQSFKVNYKFHTVKIDDLLDFLLKKDFRRDGLSISSSVVKYAAGDSRELEYRTPLKKKNSYNFLNVLQFTGQSVCLPLSDPQL